MSPTVLRLPGVKAKTGLGRTSIYGMMKTGDFPAPISLGARAVGWLSSDIDAWIQSRAAHASPRQSHGLGCTNAANQRGAK